MAMVNPLEIILKTPYLGFYTLAYIHTECPRGQLNTFPTFPTAEIRHWNRLEIMKII